MTDKRCAFCGGTRNVIYEDPVQGPVCQTCWFLAGDEDEEREKPARKGPGEGSGDPDEGTGR